MRPMHVCFGMQGDACAEWAHRRLVVAEDLVPDLAAKWGVALARLGALSGAQLAGCQYRHPLAGLVGGDYITTDSGTGLVHTAPGHGQEDYQVCVRGGSLAPGLWRSRTWSCNT